MKPALPVMAERADFIGRISSRMQELVGKLGAPQEAVEVSYQPRLALRNFDDLEEATAAFRKERTRDLKLGATFIGPHRDIIEIGIGGVPLRNYGSMGQKKTVMIAMKLAALQILSEKYGEPAILVLDEAFAQLDRDRSEALLGLLSSLGQVFLASATMTGLDTGTETKIFDVLSGRTRERQV
jgi:DNA replication and repair protein RecF